MKKILGRDVIGVFIVAWALAIGPSALAETKTYCDEKCGDSQACKFTCCHITTTPFGGVDIITGVSCSSSICCAHPQGAAVNASFGLPVKVLEGVSGPIRWGLAGIKGLDASTIVIESDDKAKTITLSGAVKSAAERDLVGATAKRQAKGYKIVNQLAIAK